MNLKDLIISVLLILTTGYVCAKTTKSDQCGKMIGSFIAENNDFSGFEIIPSEDLSIWIDNDEFIITLSRNKEYTFEFRKKGCSSKTIIVSTKNITKKQWRKGVSSIYFEIDFTNPYTDIDPAIKGKTPFVYYVPDTNSFDYTYK